MPDYKKLYEEALKRAKDLHDNHPYGEPGNWWTCEKIFPELKESEDEKIRKNICKLLWDNAPYEEAQEYIAWIEKQSKLKSKLEDKGDQDKQHLYDIIAALWDLLDKIDTFSDLQIDDTRPHNPFRKIEDITQERYKFVKSDGYNLFIEGEKITDFKQQSEQKSNKIEPKFHVGDWIVYEGLGTYKVVEIHEGWYSVIDSNDRRWSVMFESESLCHIWTIQDAKDGDVLCQDSIPFIFKCWANNCKAYCGITDFGLFKVVEDDFSWCNGFNITPATKEQHDILFQKMKEAGYEWDADKKELKKIEQKFTDKVESHFHVEKGKWYICIKNNVGITQGNVYYGISDGHIIDDNGKRYNCNDWAVFQRYLKLWTIEDAKEGDVLAYPVDDVKILIFIYEGLGKSYDGQVDCHALLDGDYFSDTVMCVCCKFMEHLTPATKEQRELLFTKMKESGYEWDADKKELKKIEQEETELPKGEDYAIDGLWQAIQILEHSLGEVDGWQSDDGILEHKCAIEAVKRLYKQKSTWSEEDKKIMSNIGTYLNRYGNLANNEKKAEEIYKAADWLKSLKDRI